MRNPPFVTRALPCTAAAMLALALAGCATRGVEAPDLVPLAAVAPGVQQDMRYHGANNFMGRPVAGYAAPTCWLSRPAAQALRSAQQELEPLGLRLKVFDYYPRVPKEALFQRGYIAARSGHSRGSTVDLTLVVTDGLRARQVLFGPLADGAEVDMGTPFDLFDAHSHTEDADQSPDVQRNRRWLRALMERHGWRNLPEEWWHFTLRNEPYPDRYFDLPVR